MAEKPRGMGRGLSAILSAAPRDEAEELRSIPVDLIAPNPHQPRRTFEEEALVALAESLRVRGVLQPVLVRPLVDGSWELIAGERRWRAAKIAGLQQIPAIIRQHDDAASLELAVIENMAREDLNPIEEARACAALVEELSLTREDVGRRVGRSRVAVSNLIRLLDLPDDALALLERGDLSEGHGRALLLAPDHGDRRRLARDAAAHGWSVRELERRARAAEETESTQRPARRTPSRVHPDQQEAISQLSDVFGSAVGSDVEVTSAGSGYRVQLSFESLDEALALARRLGVRAVA
ncbi:ParB/RepB/Spo0J family partition protein [Conexibacter stalactiti]|uniref:ParB/RepB/Spo0J family partition protein n=1 Tax=Conexibacter stalactiti TaxID=1940611 RepID=A0ABU4HIW4_9ACTN|nr:ParB/RepB/Spo0J family partition protein [Conexibacter stalactiti]MDW5593260.1 ParB/RepB/Spo0J family partition protein [Conexibacter stalactiti]MEC5033901.1 ParB/RepB/Spo0J family partition protein [Conexibacter stalactiti]